MRKIITSAFLLLLVSTITVQAQNKNQQERRAEMKQKVERRMGPEARKQQAHQAMMSKLDLNDDQEEAIKTIMLEGKKESLPVENQLGEKKARLRTLSTGDTYDVAALNKLVDEMSELQASIKKIHIAQRGKVRETLDKDQRIIFDSHPIGGEQLRRRAGKNKR